ncbi:hypothetical protein Cch01nite_03140 [Cellulomonas chitinilytica]|uniref:J domain-containing protein n=1 Tax=Cellulomonas chitinilytica TaxID=398759 RepID=A0A919NZS4_9CELL|nr:J domain-containing protein [Cellulomonas chitinilytica]GIG19590.1 hypothetical protein Cch01nite_03140 [Cellulomonas chitinilytica]
MTHYELLGVASDASDDDLRRAYRAAVRRAHPDTGGSAEQFAAVQAAWEVLSNPQRREAYDAELSGEPSWDDDAWGASVPFDDDAEVPEPARPEPARPDHVPPSDRETAPDQGPDAAWDGVVPDPYTSEPLVLPDDVDVAPEPFRPEPADEQERFARATALASAAGFVVLASLPAVRSGPRGSEPVGMACFVAVLAALVLAARSRQRDSSAARTAALVLVESVLVLVLVLGATDASGAASAMFLVAAVATATACVWVEQRHARLSRRGAHDAAHDRRVAAARAVLARAHAWNDLLAVRRDTGGTVWWVESLAGDGDATVAMVRLPDDGGAAVPMVLGAWVPAHMWVVLDADGDVVALALPGAPEEWRSVLADALAAARV